jgi:hypothetical protein
VIFHFLCVFQVSGVFSGGGGGRGDGGGPQPAVLAGLARLAGLTFMQGWAEVGHHSPPLIVPGLCIPLIIIMIIINSSSSGSSSSTSTNNCGRWSDPRL